MEQDDEKVDLMAIVAHFQAQQGLVVRVARRFSPVSDLVSDIVQQVFIDFVRFAQKNHWNPSCDSTAILYRLTRDRAVTVWRNYQKHSSVGVQKVAERIIAVAPNREESPDTLERFNEEFRSLRLCMEQLSHGSRELIERHYFNKIPIKTIAEDQGMKASSLRPTLTRIRRKLQFCIQNRLRQNKNEQGD